MLNVARLREEIIYEIQFDLCGFGNSNESLEFTLME